MVILRSCPIILLFLKSPDGAQKAQIWRFRPLAHSTFGAILIIILVGGPGDQVSDNQDDARMTSRSVWAMRIVMASMG